MVYHAQGKPEESLKYNFRALKIREKKLGPEHPKIATTLNNIAAVYYKQGMANKAIEYFKKSLFILSQTLGPNHPNTIKVKRNLDILTRTGVFDTNDPDINNQAVQFFHMLQQFKAFKNQNDNQKEKSEELKITNPAKNDNNKPKNINNKSKAISKKINASFAVNKLN